eukprot:1177914-Prorocentrum_minimum.AAC.4
MDAMSRVPVRSIRLSLVTLAHVVNARSRIHSLSCGRGVTRGGHQGVTRGSPGDREGGSPGRSPGGRTREGID